MLNYTEGLNSAGGSFTLFIPTDIGIQSSIAAKNLTCITKIWSSAPCTSVADLLSSENLENFVDNHGEGVHLPAYNLFLLFCLFLSFYTLFSLYN